MAKTKKVVTKPTAAELKAMRKMFRDKIAEAQTAFNIAENRLDTARAELECQEEFFQDADDALFDAEGDLYDFECVIEDAKVYGDWKKVLNFKASR